MNMFDAQPKLTGMVSYEEIRDLAIKIAQDQPGHVGHLGSYFTGEKNPGCFVGQMLSERGLTADDVGIGTGNLAGLRAKGLLVPEDAKTTSLLLNLQRLNDKGLSWETVVRRALELFEGDSTLLDQPVKKPAGVRGVNNVTPEQVNEFFSWFTPTQGGVDTSVSECTDEPVSVVTTATELQLA